MGALARTYSKQGRHKEAEELNVQVLEGRQRILGEDHPHTLLSLNHLATTYINQERYEEADELEVQVMGRKRVLGDEHPDTLMSMSKVAMAYSEQGCHREAEEPRARVLHARKRVHWRRTPIYPHESRAWPILHCRGKASTEIKMRKSLCKGCGFIFEDIRSTIFAYYRMGENSGRVDGGPGLDLICLHAHKYLPLSRLARLGVEVAL